MSVIDETWSALSYAVVSVIPFGNVAVFNWPSALVAEIGGGCSAVVRKRGLFPKSVVSVGNCVAVRVGNRTKVIADRVIAVRKF